MTATVSELLEERRHAGQANEGVTLFLSVLAHGAFLVALALISRPRHLPFVPMNVPVRIVSPAALGRSSGPAAARPAQAPKPKPVIEKAEETVQPSAKAMPLPKASKSKPEPPKAAGVVKAAEPAPAAPAAPALELPSAGGSPTGEAQGTSMFGTSVSAFDTDFPFAYYIEQLQQLIGANWLKPNAPEGIACLVGFKIQRSGQVTDVRVEQGSGLAHYDRAATRSIYAANPLPPLPPEYVGRELGVHIRFQ